MAPAVASQHVLAGLHRFKRVMEDLPPAFLALLPLPLPSPLPSPPAFSPHTIHALTRRQDPAPSSANDKGHVSPGSGSIDPTSVNNRILFVLFGVLGASLVVASIWFFFWARNGGFHFQEGDWEDYKSTVLRRKGKDGKTLSNATRSTRLRGHRQRRRRRPGAGMTATVTTDSIRGEFDVELDDPEAAGIKGGPGARHYRRDDDVRQYRHEKPARVGGLNRKADGSYYDPSGSALGSASEMTMPSSAAGDARRARHGPHPDTIRKVPRQPSAAYSFVQGDDASVLDGGQDPGSSSRPHQASRRPARQPHRHHRSSADTLERAPLRDGSHSPRKRYQDDVDDSTSYTGTNESGTKSYPHVIPGLTKTDAARPETGKATDAKQKTRGGYRRTDREDNDG
ncbi:MAG: hypothetical protein M1826_001198 [Phylliscum demangeonii]|nr:MAG: hypothetical protein M1826_001198 [Phylliscum demangeonii]